MPVALRRRRVPRFTAAAVATATLCVLQLLRQAGTPSWQTIWAEDGSVYSTDALNLSAVDTLFRGYAGYVQFLPRVLALAVIGLPIRRLSVALAIAASLCCALLAVFVFRCTERWIDATALRVLVTAMVALVPVGAYETTANIANLGWPLLVATFWAIVSRQGSARDTALRTVVVSVTALTTTVAVVLAPLAFGVAWLRRTRRDRIVAAAFGGSLAVQLLLDRSAGASPPSPPSSWTDLPEVFGVRVLGSMVYGERWLPTAWTATHLFLIPLTLLVLALVVGLSIRNAPADRRWFGLVSLTLSFALFAVPVWIRGTGFMHLGGDVLNRNAPRYVVAPIVVAISGLLVVVDASGRRWLKWMVAVHGIVLLAICLRMPSSRSNATPWTAEVQFAGQQCRTQPTPPSVRLGISPTPPWTVDVPCARLRQIRLTDGGVSD